MNLFKYKLFLILKNGKIKIWYKFVKYKPKKNTKKLYLIERS